MTTVDAPRTVTTSDIAAEVPSRARKAAAMSIYNPRHANSRLKFLRPSRWMPVTVMVILLAVLWQIGTVTMPYLLPPLSAIGDTLFGNPMFYLKNAWITLQEALIGLAIAFVASFVLAIVMSELPIVRRGVMPLAVVMNVTPLVAIAPALVVAFGFGPEPKLIVTALCCFFPILINVSIGLRTVPAPVLQFYTTIKASRAEMLWHVRIPSSLPYLFAALKIVFPLSIIGAVVAEMAAPGAAEGLGTVITMASSNNKLPVIYASIFALAMMGSALLAIVTAAEKKVLHWHESRAGALE